MAPIEVYYFLYFAFRQATDLRQLCKDCYAPQAARS